MTTNIHHAATVIFFETKEQRLQHPEVYKELVTAVRTGNVLYAGDYVKWEPNHHAKAYQCVAMYLIKNQIHGEVLIKMPWWYEESK